MNDVENIGLGQSLLHATQPLILVIICAKYRKKSLQNSTCCRADTTRCVILQHFYCKFMVEWPWIYWSSGKAIMRDAPSNASDYSCQIWKESFQKWRSYRADTECGTGGWTDGRSKTQYTTTSPPPPPPPPPPGGWTDGRSKTQYTTTSPPPPPLRLRYARGIYRGQGTMRTSRGRRRHRPRTKIIDK